MQSKFEAHAVQDSWEQEIISTACLYRLHVSSCDFHDERNVFSNEERYDSESF